MAAVDRQGGRKLIGRKARKSKGTSVETQAGSKVVT